MENFQNNAVMRKWIGYGSGAASNNPGSLQPVFVNKILLEQSYADSGTYGLWLLLCHKGRTEWFEKRPMGLGKLKTCTVWHLWTPAWYSSKEVDSELIIVKAVSFLYMFEMSHNMLNFLKNNSCVFLWFERKNYVLKRNSKVCKYFIILF